MSLLSKKFHYSYSQQHILTCRCSTPVKCSSCDKTFKNENLLQIHKKKHLETECNVCQKTFKTRKAMTDHRSHIHVKLIDKYCRFCKTDIFLSTTSQIDTGLCLRVTKTNCIALSNKELCKITVNINNHFFN